MSDILKGARLAAVAERIRIADEIERLDTLDTCPMCPRDIAAIVRNGLSQGEKTINLAASLAALRAENARLREALQDVIHLAQVSFDGDPYYAEQADLDGDAILSHASAALDAALAAGA